MTEAEWRNAIEPHGMLAFLRATGMMGERKRRLCAVACSRRVWHLIDAAGRRAVEVAEQFADGLANAEELRAARLACQGAGGHAAWYAAATNADVAVRNAARSAQAGVAHAAEVEIGELLAQADLVRDIFGPLPFRAQSVDSAWRTASVLELANDIYRYRTFEQMPALSDQLEKAGCDNEEILSHCRGRATHVRGCFILDLILGKE